MNSDFIQNVVLLVLTAMLTGLVAPYMLKRIDEQRESKQREIDSRRMREQQLFEADRARFEHAADKYDQNSWEFFFKVRAEISKARRLVSKDAYQELRHFYYQELIKLDEDLSTLIQDPGYTELEEERKKWQVMLESFGTTWTDRIDYFVELLANEFALAASVISQSSEQVQTPKQT